MLSEPLDQAVPIEDAVWIEALLQAAVNRADGRRERMEAMARGAAPPVQRRTGGRGGDTAHLARRKLARIPAQRASPLDEPQTLQRERRGARRDREPPEIRRGAQLRVALAAQLPPPRLRRR